MIVRVRLTPRSTKCNVDGVVMTPEGPAVLAKVRAIPEDGAANVALRELLAVWLDCPKSAVALISGERSRVKSVSITGNADEIERRLAERLDMRVI